MPTYPVTFERVNASDKRLVHAVQAFLNAAVRDYAHVDEVLSIFRMFIVDATSAVTAERSLLSTLHWSFAPGASHFGAIVAHRDDASLECVALACYAIDAVRWHTFYIRHFLVHSAYRRRGYGKCLFRKLEKMARSQRGVTHVFLEATPDSIKFWRRMGCAGRKYNAVRQLEMKKHFAATANNDD